ncbi:Uncharacterized protein Fot_50990 [Forsythia ovata]|uniref:Uncharacterized protein n=1 Tax=Forsythia ovata TaxID=205694 RepID=A0ABD1PU56_9LAMI
MGDPLHTQAKVPNQPTKPPDFTSQVVGHHSPAIPNPKTGLTPPQSGLTPSNNPQFVETLGSAPRVAATPSNGDPPTDRSPMDAPPLDDRLGGSIAPQQLAHAVLQPGASRVPLPTTSGPLAASIPPPFSGAPNSASLTSSQQIASGEAHNWTPVADSRATMPAHLALAGAAMPNANQAVPGSDGVHMDLTLQPRVAPDPILENAQDATLPGHAALPARTAHPAHFDDSNTIDYDESSTVGKHYQFTFILTVNHSCNRTLFHTDDVPPVLINPETNHRPPLRRNDGDTDSESDGHDDDDSVEKISEHSLQDSDFELFVAPLSLQHSLQANRVIPSFSQTSQSPNTSIPPTHKIGTQSTTETIPPCSAPSIETHHSHTQPEAPSRTLPNPGEQYGPSSDNLDRPPSSHPNCEQGSVVGAGRLPKAPNDVPTRGACKQIKTSRIVRMTREKIRVLYNSVSR